MNDEKLKSIALGNNFLQESDFPKHNYYKVIKSLGIYFGYDVRQRDNLYFKETLDSIKKSISLWTWRGLSLNFRKNTNGQNFCYPEVYV